MADGSQDGTEQQLVRIGRRRKTSDHQWLDMVERVKNTPPCTSSDSHLRELLNKFRRGEPLSAPAPDEVEPAGEK